MFNLILSPKTSEIYSAILVITIIFIILTVGFVVFIINYKIKQGTHLKEKKVMQEAFEKNLMQSQIEMQEMTLNELGRELHDNVGQLLSSTKLLLGVTQRTISNAPETLNLAVETLGNAIDEIRLLTKSLDREWLEQFELIYNLNAEIKRINSGKTLLINFEHPEKLPLNADHQIILFRIVQEALQNAIKYAEAEKIQIVVRLVDQFIRLEIRDNGKGFQEIEPNKGLGIRNMQKRTKLLGGNIAWTTTNDGCTVKINLPIKEEYYED